MPHERSSSLVSKTVLAAILALGLAIVGCDERPLESLGEDLLVLEGATLIDGTGADPRENSAIVIEGDRILRVGYVGEFDYPDSATRHDLSGQFVLPGFIDFHVHIRSSARTETMTALLEFGVTTVRSPGAGGVDTGTQLRDLVDSGEILGPRMVAGNTFIDGSPSRFDWTVHVATPEEIREVVRREAGAGADLVKLYWDITPELMAPAIEEAHSLGLKVAGHLRVTSWTRAAQMGIDSLVHSAADGPTWELVPESEQLELRALDYRDYYARWVQQLRLDGDAMDSLIDALVSNDVTVDPTLVMMESLYFGDDPAVLEKLEPQLAPPEVTSLWGPEWELRNPFVFQDTEMFGDTGIVQDLTSGKETFPIALQIVRNFHDRGVRLAAGTDLGMPWITPGVSFHRELELLVSAGISEADAIVIGTRNGAEGLGLSQELGTVEESKFADLVVLSANPLEDIRNTRTIKAVYRAGELVNTDGFRD